MKIHQVMEKTGLSKKAINYYESKDLLAVTKDENGYREYSQEQIEILMKIKILRKLDFNITEIEQILHTNHYEDIFHEHLVKLDRKITECQIQKDYMREVRACMQKQESYGQYERLDKLIDEDFHLKDSVDVRIEEKKSPYSILIVLELIFGCFLFYLREPLTIYFGAAIYAHALYLMIKREAPIKSLLHFQFYCIKRELLEKWDTYRKEHSNEKTNRK